MGVPFALPPVCLLVAMAFNDQVLLQVGYFIMSCLEQCPIKSIKLRLTTKSQIETPLPELKYSDANSRSLNVLPHLAAIPMLAGRCFLFVINIF